MLRSHFKQLNIQDRFTYSAAVKRQLFSGLKDGVLLNLSGFQQSWRERMHL
jgi:hypothetical protein